MERGIILIGGGGHCKSVIEASLSSGRNIIGVLDLAENIGKEVLPGIKVIGSDDDIAKYCNDALFVITVGHIKDSSLRRKIAQKVSDNDGELTTIIASTANVSRFATLGCGTVVLHGAMVNAAAKIGENCIINTLCNIEHDASVGEFSHISTGAMVNGDCKVGSDIFLGSQSVMMNGSSICDGAVIAAGSFVRKTLKIKGIYAGNPAILMKKL